MISIMRGECVGGWTWITKEIHDKSQKAHFYDKHLQLFLQMYGSFFSFSGAFPSETPPQIIVAQQNLSISFRISVLEKQCFIELYDSF
jgi:hypothetical protein